VQTPTTVDLGPLADPLTDQLRGLAPEKALDLLERDRVAITRCHLRGYMPDAPADRARQKLLRAVKGECQKFARAFNA
jgi:hypothetical protein